MLSVGSYQKLTTMCIMIQTRYSKFFQVSEILNVKKKREKKSVKYIIVLVNVNILYKCVCPLTNSMLYPFLVAKGSQTTI